MNFYDTALFHAYTVYDSDLPLENKIKLWQQIIDERPDEKINIPDLCVREKTLHGFLKRYIQLNKRMLEKFMQTDADDVFTYCEEIDGYLFERFSVFRSFEACFEEAVIIPDEDRHIHIIKKNFSEYEPMRAKTDTDGNIIEIFLCDFSDNTDEEDLIYSSFIYIGKYFLSDFDEELTCELPF